MRGTTVDAKQLKPYTFWIVAGVVVVIELGLIAFWPIEDDTGATPEIVKQNLDTEFKKLEKLSVRADNRLSGVYDAENLEDIRRLTEEYLLTPKWKSVLEPHVESYRKQLALIKKDLSVRSAILHEKIADSGSLFSWDTEYTSKTKMIMSTLYKSKVLVIDKKEGSDFETGAQIRAQVGFYTKGEKTTEAKEHPELTVRFRIIEKISEVLMAAESVSLANPVAKNGKETDLENSRSVNIKGVEWKRSGEPSKALSGTIAEIADAYELTLTLEGSASALIAAQAAIETISTPILIVSGGMLSARPPMPAGIRKNVADEPMSLRLNIVVIDFSRVLSAVTPDVVVGGAAK